MIVTIHTDAAFDPALKIGAYAYYISTSSGLLKCDSGVIKRECYSSNVAEISAILNALCFIAKYSKWDDVYRILIRTDSMVAILALQEKKKQLRKRNTKSSFNEDVRYYKYLRRISPLLKRINYRHTPAHQEGNEFESISNNWCDMEARRVLKAHKLKQNATRSV